MKYDVVTPSIGESITEVSILKWHKQSGQAVKTGELLLELESDKATVEIVAEHSGVLTTLRAPGDRIPIGEVIGIIDDAATSTATNSALMSPAVRKAIIEQGLDIGLISGTGKGGRITKADIIQLKDDGAQATTSAITTPMAAKQAESKTRRVPMSMLRQRIAERLVQAQQTAAILTTFNEVDMSAIMKFRSKHKETFKTKHGVALSFMSFFTRACIETLKQIPEVNASIDGNDIVYHDYYDVGIAVGTDRGLVVPIIRDAENMNLVEIEKKIAALALKARNAKLSIDDLSGGTFTISNGGVYGSLLSTPILNPPQSGILGMHKIQDRPVAVDQKIEIRPMMYLALSYDHRLIDGKSAVTFLVTVKDYLEHPEKLGLEF
jgi:2-oxoglutarate dehydrogenase E2 component (dihydrolipoamide succinyltransferase)